MTGSEAAIAAATAAKASCAGSAPSRQLSGRSGQAIQQPACGSNSAGIRKPSAAGVESSVALTATSSTRSHLSHGGQGAASGGYSRWMEEIRLIVATDPLESPARTRPPEREPFRIGAVQQRWHPDPDEHEAALAAGIELAAGEGARLVCLQELTLSRYFAVDAAGPRPRAPSPRSCPAAPPTASPRGWRRRPASTSTPRSTSAPTATDGLGFNTAIVVSPDGELVARTRKLHIPVTAGYYEDRYFRPGPAGADAYPVLALGEARLGLPTCWDQWFPEVARAYSLAGADVARLPDRDRLRARPPRLRHRAALAAGDRRQRDRQRHLHGGREPVRRPSRR